MINKQDKEALRRLASEYMQAALSPVQAKKITLWRALNRSEMQRPMVTIDQLPWMELDCEELRCEVSDGFWRGIELELRRQLYKWRHFPVDMVLEPYIAVPLAVHNSGFSLPIQVERLGEPGTSAYSQHFTPSLRTMADVEKIGMQEITHDEAESARRLAEAQEIFDGIAPVEMHGIGFHLGVWDYLSSIMGPDNVFFALTDEPELVHAAMERLTQSVLHGVAQANAMQLHNDLTNLCHCSYIYTDTLRPGVGHGRGTEAQDCWTLGLAQLFTAVSPQMFAEFELPYIQRMAEPFGMIYYGCCDKLDDRLDSVKKIPHVRKVSCSPWSDRKHFAEEIGTELIFSNKPTPAYLATPEFDEQRIRADLTLTYDLARANGANLEFLLKDVSTVLRDPRRLVRWAQIAMEVVQK